LAEQRVAVLTATDSVVAKADTFMLTRRGWVAIANSRIIAAAASGVTFSYKDYRIEGPGRYKTPSRGRYLGVDFTPEG
jgi:hypothetical protein